MFTECLGLLGRPECFQVLPSMIVLMRLDSYRSVCDRQRVGTVAWLNNHQTNGLCLPCFLHESHNGVLQGKTFLVKL